MLGRRQHTSETSETREKEPSLLVCDETSGVVLELGLGLRPLFKGLGLGVGGLFTASALRLDRLGSFDQIPTSAETAGREKL